LQQPATFPTVRPPNFFLLKIVLTWLTQIQPKHCFLVSATEYNESETSLNDGAMCLFFSC